MFLGPGDDDDIVDGEWREITKPSRRASERASMFSGCGQVGGVMGVALLILLIGFLMMLFIEIQPYLVAN